jgi:hypothetical protein
MTQVMAATLLSMHSIYLLFNYLFIYLLFIYYPAVVQLQVGHAGSFLWHNLLFSWYLCDVLLDFVLFGDIVRTLDFLFIFVSLQCFESAHLELVLGVWLFCDNSFVDIKKNTFLGQI